MDIEILISIYLDQTVDNTFLGFNYQEVTKITIPEHLLTLFSVVSYLFLLVAML